MFILCMHFSFWLYTCFHKSAVFLAGPRWPNQDTWCPAAFLVASGEGAVPIGHQLLPRGLCSQLTNGSSCGSGYSQGFSVRGRSHWELIASRTPFLALPVHSQCTVWPSAHWFSVHCIPEPSHEKTNSQTVCIPTVACHPEWLISTEAAALGLSCCLQPLAWELPKGTSFPLNPSSNSIHLLTLC